MVDPDKKDVLSPIKEAMKDVKLSDFYLPVTLIVFGFMCGAMFAYAHGMVLCNSAVDEVIEEYQCFIPGSGIESSSEKFSSVIPNECYYYCENCKNEEEYYPVE